MAERRKRKLILTLTQQGHNSQASNCINSTRLTRLELVQKIMKNCGYIGQNIVFISNFRDHIIVKANMLNNCQLTGMPFSLSPNFQMSLYVRLKLPTRLNFKFSVLFVSLPLSQNLRNKFWPKKFFKKWSKMARKFIKSLF